MSMFKFVFSSPDTPEQLQAAMKNSTTRARETARKLINFIKGAVGGSKICSFTQEFGRDIKTVTFASVTSGSEIVINGYKYTAVSAGGALASAYQFSVSGGSDTLDAGLFIEILNNATYNPFAGKLLASSLGAVVTLMSDGANDLKVSTNKAVLLAVANVAGAVASAKVSLSALASATSAGDTVEINGVVFTVGTAQDIDNATFYGLSASTQMTSLAATINGSRDPRIRDIVSAVASLATVTVSARSYGEAGNCIHVAAGTNIVISGSVITKNSQTYLGGGSGLSGYLGASSEKYSLGY